MNKPTLKSMKEEDLDQVLAIEKACFPKPLSKSLFLDEIKLNIAHPQVLILEDKIIAYFDYWLIPPEAQLITLCVAPHFQKKGFGSYLMNEFVKQCERFLLKEIFLEVRVSNEKAIALYEKFKFEKTQKRKAYYSDNKEDAWVMKRMLKV